MASTTSIAAVNMHCTLMEMFTGGSSGSISTTVSHTKRHQPVTQLFSELVLIKLGPTQRGPSIASSKPSSSIISMP